MGDRIRWGILSTANIGRKRVVPAIQKSSNGLVAAVASRNRDNASEFASQFDMPIVHDSYDDLLADDSIDAIYNPLPNSLHAEWAIKAAEAGKPMLCEKPLAIDAAQAQQMVAAFRTRNVLFAEAFMYRFHPQTHRVLSMVNDGVIGDLHSVNATFVFNLRNAENIRLNKDLAGGSLMDVGCYCLNVMRLMTGEEPDSVTGQQILGETGVDVAFTGTLRFPSGVIGHFDSALRSYRTHTYTLIGSQGRIHIGEAFVPEPDSNTTVSLWRDGSVEQIEIPGADHYQIMVEDFADSLLTGRTPAFEPEDGVANMQVIDRLKAAAAR